MNYSSLGIIPYEGEEFLPGAWIVPEDPQHARRRRFAVELLHASHHHAHVPAVTIDHINV